MTAPGVASIRQQRVIPARRMTGFLDAKRQNTGCPVIALGSQVEKCGT